LTQGPLITCKELIDFLMDYVDDALPADRRNEFERHLRVCPACVAYLETYRQTVRLGRMALDPADDRALETVPRRLIEAIRAARLKGS